MWLTEVKISVPCGWGDSYEILHSDQEAVWSIKMGRSPCSQVLKSVKGLESPILLSFQQGPWPFPYQDEYMLQPGHVTMEDTWLFRLPEIYKSTTCLGKFFQ